MTPHPNHQRVQAGWDGLAAGDMTAAAELTATDVKMIHGPGAGPFAGPGRGMDRMLEMALYFDEMFGGTFHQRGTCLYADEDVAVALVQETGTSQDGGVFKNRALWINRFGAEGKVDYVWTVDLDEEAMHEFWAKRNAAAS
jgi:hypothetical protein